MKFLMLLIASLTLPHLALAKIPLRELEMLRQKTVVLHVALDKPDSEQVKACKKDLDAEKLSSKLARVHDEAATEWKKTLLTAEDVKSLITKAKYCSPRASCLVYETFANSAKTSKPATKRIEALKDILDQQVKSMSGDTYQQAWKTVPNPCHVLSSLKP